MQEANITVLIAFLAGLASFLSPCVLPLVPGYVSLISGVSIDSLKAAEGSRAAARRAVIVNSLAFNVGLSIIFVSLGAAAGWIGATVISNPWVRVIGGLVIIGFGLQLMGVLKIGALYKDTRQFSNDKPRGPLGSLLLGIAFAAGWTPCIGPILGGIIGLAATSGGWKSGLLLSSFYAAGLAVPFLLTGLGINQFLGFYARFRKHLHKVEVVSGVMLILIGLLIVTNRVTRIASLAASLPSAENLVSSLAGKRDPAAPAAANQVNPASFARLPDAEFRTLDGQAYSLNDLRGRVVLVNFWATWCGPCRAEIPEFNVMQRELEGRGLTIVGVSTQDTPEQIRNFQRDLKQDYQLLLAGDDVPAKFGNGPGLPVSYILDREGRVRKKVIGASDRAGFESVIKPLLDEASATARTN
ncbi:MAG TPA: cytochrome c biogenesis protein CcdA [Pyrinomonadaceae bacterium]|nr:cytochrome c biogenesis protein CcdA [Pyrinomonadaceae bacterium]